MKTEKNILIAFILNLSFSIFEFIGGIFTGSVAIDEAVEKAIICGRSIALKKEATPTFDSNIIVKG